MDMEHLSLDQADRLAAGLPEDHEPLLTTFCREFGVSEHAAVEMLDWLDRHRPRQDASLDAVREVDGRYRHGLTVLCHYQRSRRGKDAALATHAMALVLGIYPAAGAEIESELAKSWGVKKQTVNKMAEIFRRALGIGEYKRRAEDKAAMRKARLEQLHT